MRHLNVLPQRPDAGRRSLARLAPRVAVLLLTTLAAAPGAHAMGAVRGALAPPAYGGSLMIGSLGWLDTKDALLTGSTKVSDPQGQHTRDLYLATGVYYGVGPNTLIGVYLPYDSFRRFEHDVVMSEKQGLSNIQLLAQQRVLRHDGTRSRTELAVGLRGFFEPPGDEEFPAVQPNNYRVSMGVQRSGWRSFATTSVAYTGAAHKSYLPLGWTINSSWSMRPSTSWMAKGHDLAVGLESNFKTAANGSSRRLLLGPMVEVYPFASMSIAASYGVPVYEKVTPKGLGGGRSLWVSTYLLY